MMSEREPITKPVYVTKWALTTGILVFNTGELIARDSGGHYFSSGPYFIGPEDWFDDLEQAQQRVKLLANRKIESANRQITKMKSIIRNGVKLVEKS